VPPFVAVYILLGDRSVYVRWLFQLVLDMGQRVYQLRQKEKTMYKKEKKIITTMILFTATTLIGSLIADGHGKPAEAAVIPTEEVIFELPAEETTIVFDHGTLYMSSTQEEVLFEVLPVEQPTLVADGEIPPRYGFTDEDVYLLAQLLCGSAGYDGDGEYDFVYSASIGNLNDYEIAKVLCVVMNRVNSSKFPNTVREVVLQKGQFAVMPRNSYKQPADLAIDVVRDWCVRYDREDTGAQCIPENHLFFSAGKNLTNVTRENWR